MRRIRRPACGNVGAAQGGTGSCFLRDPPGPRLPRWSAPGRGRGRRGEEDDPIAGVADAWGLVVRRLARCGCVRCVMADEQARLVSGCARAGGDAGPASWATHVKGQARLGWASWAGRGRLGCCCSLLFLFFFCLFLFSFFCFDSLLVRV